MSSVDCTLPNVSPAHLETERPLMAAATVPRELIDIVNVVTLSLTEAVFVFRRALLSTHELLSLILTELLQLSLLGLLGDHLHKFQLGLKRARPLSHCSIF